MVRLPETEPNLAKPGEIMSQNPLQPGASETPLAPLLKADHPLVQLALAIDWDDLEQESASFASEVGRPTLPTRLMVGLHYLKALYDESDESVVEKWIENPYWQYFCGEQNFQHDFPRHPSSLVKWRKRVGVKGVEKLLKQVLRTAIDFIGNSGKL
jgi:transposase, IS5 family